jgi:hypothetical protein
MPGSSDQGRELRGLCIPRSLPRWHDPDPLGGLSPAYIPENLCAKKISHPLLQLKPVQGHTRRSVKRTRRTASAASRNTKAIKAIKRKLTRGDLTKSRIQLQHDVLPLVQGWNRRILIDPVSITQPVLSGAGTPAWRYVFDNVTENRRLAQKDDLYIHGLQLTQHFNLKALRAKNVQLLSAYPVTTHNYVVSLRQDFGAVWNSASDVSHPFNPGYFAQNVHYALLGNNQAVNGEPAVGAMSSYAQTFLLNKKLFKVHAEHHHSFSPNWLSQYIQTPPDPNTPDPNYGGLRTGLGAATQKSAFMVTWRDNIKLKIKLSAR